MYIILSTLWLYIAFNIEIPELFEPKNRYPPFSSLQISIPDSIFNTLSWTHAIAFNEMQSSINPSDTDQVVRTTYSDKISFFTLPRQQSLPKLLLHPPEQRRTLSPSSIPISK